MAKKSSSRVEYDKAGAEGRAPKSLAIARRGINTSQQFCATMSALMTDLLDGSVTPDIGNATCNAGGKLLKMVELNQKYGKAQVDSGLKNLQLVHEIEAEEEDA